MGLTGHFYDQQDNKSLVHDGYADDFISAWPYTSKFMSRLVVFVHVKAGTATVSQLHIEWPFSSFLPLLLLTFVIL